MSVDKECDNCCAGPATRDINSTPCGQYVLGFYKIDKVNLTPLIVRRTFMDLNTWYDQDGGVMEAPYKIAFFNNDSIYRD